MPPRFDELIVEKKTAWVVFTQDADYCPPCAVLLNRFDEARAKVDPGHAATVWLADTMMTPHAFFDRWQVKNVPQIVAFKSGVMMERLIGGQHSQDEIEAFYRKWL